MATDALKKELAQLKKEKSAFQAQSALIEKFISMVKSPDEPMALNRIWAMEPSPVIPWDVIMPMRRVPGERMFQSCVVLTMF